MIPWSTVSRLVAVALSLSLCSGCSRLPIEDGQKIGSLVQVKDSFTSCFLLEYEPGQVAFFDACYKDSGRAVEGALEDRNLSPRAVQSVFLTHGHSDHLGGLSVLPQTTVHALAAERSLVSEEGGRVDVALQDGDEIELGSHVVRVFAVTGHTAGSAVYEVDGVLVMGDTVIAQKDGSLAPPPERYSDRPAENNESVRELVDRLDAAEIDIQWVAPSHSGPVRGSKALRRF